MDPVIVEQLGRTHPLARHLDDFLTDLANAGASAHPRRAYRGDLTAAPIRAFLAELAKLSPASRKRKRAAVASFAKWALRHDLLQANPMELYALLDDKVADPEIRAARRRRDRATR